MRANHILTGANLAELLSERLLNTSSIRCEDMSNRVEQLEIGVRELESNEQELAAVGQIAFMINKAILT